MNGFVHKLTRKKEVSDLIESSELHRCISVWELTLMGIGGMVGSGIYFLVGQAAKEQAGPAIVVSFALAFVVVALAAACYTEFAARVSKTGSIYLYMYMSLGEFMAFMSGWCALMSTISGGATNGRAWSAYLDSLLHHSISNFTKNSIAEWTYGDPLSPYPDFVASGIIMIMSVVVASGANCSAKFTAIFAGFNVCVLLFCCIVGFIYGDVENWTNPETDGYFPFGWSGVIAGAASCFWAFSGFEIIGASVEEVKNPKRSIPLSTGCALGLVTVLYIVTSASLTYVTSYKNLDLAAPLPSAFSAKGLDWAYYVVSIGPLCGLTTTLFSAQYGFVRIAYAMAQDGLLFPFFHIVNKRTKVPVWTTLCGGVIMAVTACFLDIRNIISFGIIVTLVQFVLVSACVIVLRYRPDKNNRYGPITLPSDEDLNAPKNLPSPYQWKMTKFRETALHANGLSGSLNNLLENGDADNQIESTSNRSSVASDNLDHLDSISQTSVDNFDDFQYKDRETGTLKPAFKCMWRCLKCFPKQPGRCVCLSVSLVTICLTIVAMLVIYADEHLHSGSLWSYIILVILFLVTCVLLFIIYSHRQSRAALTLKVPCVPWLPATSFLLCVLLMISAATKTSWIVFIVILILGIIVYFSYGIRHSVLNKPHIHVEHISGDAVALLDDSINVSDEEF